MRRIDVGARRSRVRLDSGVGDIVGNSGFRVLLWWRCVVVVCGVEDEWFEL